MAEILKKHAEELPGFPAMNDPSRAIRGATGRLGDSGALAGETGPVPVKGI
jgi:hypothetical protein